MVLTFIVYKSKFTCMLSPFNDFPLQAFFFCTLTLFGCIAGGGGNLPLPLTIGAGMVKDFTGIATLCLRYVVSVKKVLTLGFIGKNKDNKSQLFMLKMRRIVGILVGWWRECFFRVFNSYYS